MLSPILYRQLNLSVIPILNSDAQMVLKNTIDLVVKWEKEQLVAPLKEVINSNFYLSFLESFRPLSVI